jgi:membrane protease YdiL (CAAX protease family)
MMDTRQFLRHHSLVLGIILMFLLTWPIDLANSGVLPIQVPFAIYITLGYGFVIAAVIMTWLTLGGPAVIDLLKRYLLWRVEIKWYLVAFFLFPLIQLAAIYLGSLISRTAVDFSTAYAYNIFGPSASLPLFVLPFFLFDALTNGEEIGWRGYVLPRLQTKNSALVASLITGVIWGFWHLPKFLMPENNNPFGWFMVQITLEAVLYTWLYNNTRGSLLLVTLFHAASNIAAVFMPVENAVGGTNLPALYIQIAIEALIVLAVVITAGPANLSRTQSKQVQD